MPTVAVVLSGCGVFDGSEIHESVAVLYHLSRLGAEYHCFAPDIEQAQVIDHYTHKPVEGEKRSVLSEAARIARGAIRPLRDLKVEDVDAVFFPGGFGAAKNLSSFATKGAGCEVNPEVERVIKAFYAAEKPVGMCCIAPVLAAKVLGKSAGGPGVTVTVGDDAGAAAAIAEMGSQNVVRPVTESYTDSSARVVTAPAYMYEAPIHEVFRGIGEMVERTLALTNAPAMR